MLAPIITAAIFSTEPLPMSSGYGDLAFLNSVLNSVKGEGALKATCNDIWFGKQSGILGGGGACKKAQKEIREAKAIFPSLLKYVDDYSDFKAPDHLTLENYPSVINATRRAIGFSRLCNAPDQKAIRAAKTMDYWGTSRLEGWYLRDLAELKADQSYRIIEACAKDSWADKQAKYLNGHAGNLQADALSLDYSILNSTNYQVRIIGLQVERREKLQALAISKVVPNSPAFQAGLQSGDLILSINKQTTKDFYPQDFVAAVSSIPDGQSVSLEIMRDGATAQYQLIPSLVSMQRDEEVCIKPVESLLSEKGSEQLTLQRNISLFQRDLASFLSEDGIYASVVAEGSGDRGALDRLVSFAQQKYKICQSKLDELASFRKSKAEAEKRLELEQARQEREQQRLQRLERQRIEAINQQRRIENERKRQREAEYRRAIESVELN